MPELIVKTLQKLPRKFRINRASHKSQKKQSHIWPTPQKKINKIQMTHQENNASKICRPMLVINKILHHPSNKTIYLIPLCKTYLVLTSLHHFPTNPPNFWPIQHLHPSWICVLSWEPSFDVMEQEITGLKRGLAIPSLAARPALDRKKNRRTFRRCVIKCVLCMSFSKRKWNNEVKANSPFKRISN